MDFAIIEKAVGRLLAVHPDALIGSAACKHAG